MPKSFPLLLLLFSVSLHAQTPYLVKDINTTFSSETKSSSPGEFIALGNRIFFVAQTEDSGRELWVTDGTSAGTSMVADIVPGNADSAPYGLIVVNGVLLFNARDANHGIEFWTSDGTTAGTHLFMDINPGPSSSQPGVRLLYKNGMVFTGDDGTNGRELWFTDGTVAGTRLVKDITAGAASSPINYLFAFNNDVFFYFSGQLWKTDATSDGTVKVMTVSGRNFCPLGNRIFFEGPGPGGGLELFVSDGTEAGTHLVTEINPGPAGAFDSFDALGFTPFGNGVLFPANDGTHGHELWFSDGTAAGTRMVGDLIPGAKGTFDNSYAYLTTIGNRAYFQGRDDDHGAELWVTDGTEGGTKLFADVNPGQTGSSPMGFSAIDGKIYFYGQVGSPITGARLFVTDGGPPHALGNGSWPRISSSSFWLAGGKVYFAGTDPLTGTEPWVTDGTDAGTHLIANIVPDGAPSSDPRISVAVGDTLLFFANADTPQYSVPSLWRTDGTPAGTYMVVPADRHPAAVTPVGPVAFFNTSDDTVNGKPTMMRTDGTVAGTAENSDFLSRFGKSKVSTFYPIGDALYVTATATNIGYSSDLSLWRTTAAPGAPATELGSINPYQLLSIGGRLYFYAAVSESNTYDRALWTSDGTPAGTYAVMPVLNSTVYDVGDFVNAAGTLYFVAQHKDEKAKLWKSDGTFDGTVAVKELGVNAGVHTSIAAVGHRVFFVAGGMLWTSDGTEAGTVSLSAIGSGPGQDFRFFVAGDHVLFDSYDRQSSSNDIVHQIWTSDGTVAGTKMLLQQKKILPQMVSIAGTVYFTGFDDAHGAELWTSDGTAEGTKLFADINPGPHSSYASQFSKAGNTIYFSAYADSTGNELWALPLGDGTLSIDDARATEGDSGTTTMRFHVTLSAPAAKSVTVEYATADGTAQSGQDYDAASGTLTFAPGETSKTIEITVRGDVAIESNETLFVRLHNGSARILKSEGAGVIDDDDVRADVAIEPQFSGSATNIGTTLKIMNNGPRGATSLALEIDGVKQPCFNCGSQIIPQLAAGTSQQVFLYNNSYQAQTVRTAVIRAREADPQPANNAVAWLVGANTSMVMSAAYLTPGATATIYGTAYVSDPVPVSSDPSVVSVSANTTKLTDYIRSFTVTGVKPGTATITFDRGSLVVTVVAAGTTPRWSGGVQLSTGSTATTFDKPLTVIVSPNGKAPFTGVTPTGTVRVTSGDRELARRTFTSTATFSFPVYMPVLGTNPYTVSYDGDAVFLPESITGSVYVSSGYVTLLGNLEPVSTPSTYRLTISATGSPVSPPGGTVSVLNGTTEIAKLTLVPGADGKSTAQMTVTGPNAPTLTLNYSGDAFYNRSTQQVRNVTPRQHAVRH